jgi:prophage antirepressor-like protein
MTKSAKLIAKTFLTKYLTEIMPQIRKTGNYISNKSDMKKIKKLNDKISNYILKTRKMRNAHKNENFLSSNFCIIIS